MTSLFTHLACGRCDTRHEAWAIQTICESCGGPLLARYAVSAGAVSLEEVLSRPAGQNRCHEMGPTRAGAETPTLGEGGTALLGGERLRKAFGLPGLLIKDESRNPTLSFKARGMAAAVARAAELGVKTVCLPSAGNAAGAAAAYGALHGLAVVVALPESTPTPIATECHRLGARVMTVPGTIADAGRVLANEKEDDWFSLATLREPYRLEGKKVMGYELLYDLGRLPDVVVYPTGGGTGLIGMWKAFAEMEALGWIGSERPRMVSVQMEGCAPMVRAFEAGLDHAVPWEDPAPSAAFGLRVPAALGDFLILRAVRESSGTAVAVGEEETLAATSELAGNLGIQGSTEGGACLVATRRLLQQRWLSPDETIVVFNTGHDLKY